MNVNIKLSRGSHGGPEQGACVMELAAYLTNDEWTDLPQCTNSMIGRFAQAAWDSQAEADMPKVARDFLPRLLRAKRTTNDAEINRKLRRFCVERAVASAKSVQHLAKNPERAAQHITAAEEWLASGAKPAADAYADAAAAADADAAAYAYADAYAYAYADAAAAAYAAAYAYADAYAAAAAAAYAYAYADADAYAAAAAAAAAYAYAYADAYADADAYAAAAAAAAAYAKPLGLAASRLRLLDELLDYHEKLLVEAGEYLWDPREWEDEAIAFVDSLA